MGLRGKMIGVFFIGFSLLALPALLIASTTLIPQRVWELVALIVLLLVGRLIHVVELCEK